MHDSRPRRSVLFMPGANARALSKARTLAADSLIFDLEDAVAPAAKQLAREQVIQALRAGGYQPREVMVRINALDTPWGEADVQALMGEAGRGTLTGLVLPKVENPAQLHELSQIVRGTHGRDGAGNGAPLAMWVMIESPEGVALVDDIARTCAELWPTAGALVMGTNDLAKALKLPHDPQRNGMLTALSLCVLAARRYGLDVLDGVYANLSDAEGLARQCLQGRSLGFDGKTLIHPNQIDASNRLFAPDPADLAHARRVVEAWRAAQSGGDDNHRGVVVVDGAMVEGLHVEQASALLAKAEAIEARTRAAHEPTP